MREREGALRTVAEQFASLKVRNLNQPAHPLVPLYGEIEFEKRRLSQPNKSTFGLLYDGFSLMNNLHLLIPDSENNKQHIHVVFTNQLIGTYDENDRRYHARVAVFGYPNILSSTGLVEAPAKPREYYLLKQRYESIKMADAVDIELKEQFRDNFIDFDDKRLTDVVKGYVAQAVFYHLTGEPFCSDSNCRLFNAHWQSEVLAAQLNGRDFCAKHEDIIRNLSGEMI
ncbi:MAG: hypothetical protein Q8P44_01255 [Dehalococcoidia bacterium]|nr:hypothetical protein [Dehalococcoidia bacterium]